MRPARGDILAPMLDRFETAVRAAGGTEVHLAIGRRTVRLRFAGPGLLPCVAPAFAHVRSRPVPRADLTVHLWDTASTGVAMLPPPWSLEALGIGGIIPAAAEDGLHAAYRMDTGMFTVLDVETGTAVLWMRDARRLDRHDRAAPLRQVLGSFLARHGLCMTHAGAVGRDGRGVLLGGKSGSGKSTTSLLCLEAGLSYAGDDNVLVDPAPEGAPYVHSLYATGKVFPTGMAALFPKIEGAFERPPADTEKAIGYFAGDTTGMSRGFTVAGLLLPVVTGRSETRVVPISQAEGLRGLAPSTIFQHGSDAAPMLALLARAVSRVPCHRLELGTDYARIPARIAEVIDARGAA